MRRSAAGGPAAQHQREVLADGDVGVAVVGGGAGFAADGGGDLPTRRVTLAGRGERTAVRARPWVST